MNRIGQLPIFILSRPARLWLEEVYRRNRLGERFVFEEVRIALDGQIPDDFRYEEIDKRLLEHNGTSITVLGILALEPDNPVVEDINRIGNIIKKLIKQNFERENIVIKDIAASTEFTVEYVSFLIHLLTITGVFSTGSSHEQNSVIYRSIRTSGSEAVFNNYMSFSGIEEIILNKLNSYGPQPGPRPSQEEIFSANEKLDLILEKLREVLLAQDKLSFGQEIIWTDVRNDINELRTLYSLSKKNWRQLLIGKITEWTLSGIISEAISKEIVQSINLIAQNVNIE